MASKEQTHSNDKASLRQKSPKPATENLDTLAQQQTHLATIVQRVKLNPRSLTSSDVLQFQHTIGNQAVARLLAGTGQRQVIQKKENNTGLPDNLKIGVENLSGIAMDDVEVHYNSARPSELQALAYTQGNEIHVESGQEHHLPHEAWHVVQQKQGKVKPTFQAKGMVINDDERLEREADAMGAKALRMAGSYLNPFNGGLSGQKKVSNPIVQRVIYPDIGAFLAGVWPGQGAVPDVNNFSDTLQSLFNDAENQLPRTDVILTPEIGRIAEAGFNPHPPPDYVINYNPALGTPNFLIASMLHELLHVSTQVNYRKHGVPFDWLNLNLPPGLALPADVGAEVDAQIAVLDQNLQDALAVVNGDATLPPDIQTHVVGRLEQYARPMPDVHYDTVIADILAYLELNNINGGPTFNFIKRMVKESTDRRLVNPWWGTKSARRVDRNKSFWQFWKW